VSRPAARLRATLAFALLATTLAACSSDGSSGGTVTNPTPPVSAIAITVPATLSVRQGGTVTVPITIRRTDYTGVVFVNFSGLPTGVVAPVVSSTSTNAFNIPLVVDTLARVGAASVRVTAQGIDVATQTADFSLTVTAR
jgi:hypothetical protein